MATPPPRLLQCSVKLLFLSEEQLLDGLHLSNPSPKAFQLEVLPREEVADMTVTDAEGVCVFKCLVNEDTEYCRVGKESVLITLGYTSALLQFRSHSEYSLFSNALKNCRNQKKEHSVFNQRTEEASAAQYFQVAVHCITILSEFYGCLSQQQNMMQDFVRTATYHRAILQNRIDFKDKVVLDVGCGSGILSFFAVQAGARKVYAVEASSVAKYAEILVRRQVQVCLPQDVRLPDGSANNLITEKLMIELCSKPVCILFCPRSVLEVTVVLRQIGLQCHQVSCQVISTCEARYKQWINKSLRSRQRQNYLHLRRSIKCLLPVLQLILILITLELINIHTVCVKNPTEYQQYLKFLKMILQYTENLVTYTSPEKNKWEETLELTHKALIKIRTFLEKQQMLMQLAK